MGFIWLHNSTPSQRVINLAQLHREEMDMTTKTTKEKIEERIIEDEKERLALAKEKADMIDKFELKKERSEFTETLVNNHDLVIHELRVTNGNLSVIGDLLGILRNCILLLIAVNIIAAFF